MTTGRGDRGYATIWVVTAMGLVIAASLVAMGYAAAVERRHRAAGAADAAALDAALHAVDGAASACSGAASIARQDGGRVTSCTLDGATARVTVAVALPGPLAALGSATGRARAGPVGTAIA